MVASTMAFESCELISAVRDRAPLVHNITNYVVMNFTANALLAVGAAPVMAHAVEEMDAMVGLASALVINIGTLSRPWIEAMQLAAQSASDRGIPLVLDPVGAGATELRTRTAGALIENSQGILIRGNASEICALANEAVETRGVDSTLGSEEAIRAAQVLARQHRATVIISGKVDHIIDAQRHVEVHNGDRIMARVTGTGCTASALLGAFAATTTDAFTAAVVTMMVMGVAGEMAAQQSTGPGTFVPHFLDALASLTPDRLSASAKVVSRSQPEPFHPPA